MNSDKIERLKLRFNRAVNSECPSPILERFFKQLLSHYTESHRFYHTLGHINACLDHLEEFQKFHKLQSNQSSDKVNFNQTDSIDFNSIEIALWFHDIIYNPKNNNNEELSAQFAEEACRALLISQKTIEKVRRLILLTKHPSKPSSIEEKLMLDIDLSILGANSSLFESYQSWIRKEFIHVNPILYYFGRRKVLRSFEIQRTIYHTKYFHDKLESQARKNLSHALSILG